MKRFWTEAAIAEQPEGWSVELDGKPVRIPGGAPLLLASLPLAEAVADEWRQAGSASGDFSYNDLPLTRLAGTAQDRVAVRAEAVALELARFGESDLLCYRAERPEALRQRQDALWQPWLDWAARRHGAELHVTQGIVHVPQRPASLAALAAAVARQDLPGLAGLGVAVPILGSLVLGLAWVEGELDAAAAHALATLDERYQAEQWGIDDEALARGLREAADVALAARYVMLARDAGGKKLMAARRLIISGRVQGIGYRDWMIASAEALGLSGWVRNRRDGTVEALIDGPEPAIEELLRACRRGPRLAEVSGIVEELAEPPPEPGFRRRPTE